MDLIAERQVINDNGIMNRNEPFNTLSTKRRKLVHVKRKSAEPRPHPARILNKRYWDGIRAKREATQINGNQKAAGLQSRRLNQDGSCGSPSRRISSRKTRGPCAPHSIASAQAPRPGHNSSQQPAAAGGLPPHIPSLGGPIGPLPLVPFPLLPLDYFCPVAQTLETALPRVCNPASNGDTRIESTAADCRRILPNLALSLLRRPELLASSQRQLLPPVSSKLACPSVAAGGVAQRESATDAEVDVLTDSLLHRNRRQINTSKIHPDHNGDSSSFSLPPVSLVPVPVPVPIIVPIPVTTEFILRHYGRDHANRHLP